MASILAVVFWFSANIGGALELSPGRYESKVSPTIQVEMKKYAEEARKAANSGDYKAAALAVCKEGIVSNVAVYEYPLTIPAVPESADWAGFQGGCSNAFTVSSSGDLLKHSDAIHCAAAFVEQKIAPCFGAHTDIAVSVCAHNQAELWSTIYGEKKFGLMYWSGSGANWLSMQQAINMASTMNAEAKTARGYTSLEGTAVGFILNQLINPTKYNLTDVACLYPAAPAGADAKCGSMANTPTSKSPGPDMWDVVSKQLSAAADLSLPVTVSMRDPKLGSYFWKSEIVKLGERLKLGDNLKVLLYYSTQVACEADKVTANFYYGESPEAGSPYEIDCTSSCEEFVRKAYNFSNKLAIAEGASMDFYCWNQPVDAGHIDMLPTTASISEKNEDDVDEALSTYIENVAKPSATDLGNTWFDETYTVLAGIEKPANSVTYKPVYRFGDPVPFPFEWQSNIQRFISGDRFPNSNLFLAAQDPERLAKMATSKTQCDSSEFVTGAADSVKVVCVTQVDLNDTCNIEQAWSGQRQVVVPGCAGIGCNANGKDSNCAWCVYDINKCEQVYGKSCKETKAARDAQNASCGGSGVSLPAHDVLLV